MSVSQPHITSQASHNEECGMTSWVRNSPLRVSLGRRRSASPLHDVDPAAAFHSFIKHWQQTCDIFERTQLRGQIFADDVTAVINHLAQMVTLLLVDLKQMMVHGARTQNGKIQKNNNKAVAGETTTTSTTTSHPLAESTTSTTQHSSLPTDVPPNTPIFDHFLGEEILERILDWSLKAGEFVSALKLEQLKVHEQLLSHSRQEILVYKPIIRPLLKLLWSCSGCVHADVEKRLVVLLNQLCVSLMHNQHLLDFFFQFSDEQGPTKFVIFSLLLPYVHRDGGVGQQARDALLLCMALSASHTAVGQYIAQHSNFCPVLAAGLSGLYSMLPRSLTIESEGWHRLTAEDIIDMPQLQLFLNSLEFCNAVVQVAHPLVRKQLVEFLYQGFLVPVLGPALHQGEAAPGEGRVHNSPIFMAVMGEVVAATAYTELCLRTVTEPQLLRVFLAFLLVPPPGPPSLDPPIITLLISRLHSSNTQLCLVTLSLFWTLVELNCEDLMVALVFQYLTPCTHVMLSQRSCLTQPPCPAAASAPHKLLNLTPAICKVENTCNNSETAEAMGCPQTFCSSHPSPSTLPLPHRQRSFSTASTCSTESELLYSDQPTAYSDYLLEARARVAATSLACSQWTWHYDGLHPSPSQAVEMLEVARLNPSMLYPKSRSQSDPMQVQSEDSLPHQAKVRSATLNLSDRTSNKSVTKSVLNGVSDNENLVTRSGQDGMLEERGAVASGGERGIGTGGEEENLDSLGESSGYESFNIRASRDSSPVNSSDGYPRSQQGIEPTIEMSQRLTANLKHLTNTLGEDDQEFIESLQRSTTPTELTGLEETLCEIDQAFTSFKIYDISSSSNKVYCLEVVGEDGEWDSLPWQNHEPSPTEVTEKTPATELQTRPTIGPFLEALMLRVDQMLNTNIHVNLLATTIISRLASYPTPLLSTLLLDSTIVFQPAVRSLVQVMSGLKQRIDALLTFDDTPLLVEARAWFMMRVIIPRPFPSRPRTPSVSSTASTETLLRGEGRRRSISRAVSSLFRRAGAAERPHIKESPLEHLPDKSGYRFIKRSVVEPAGGPVSEKQHAARCAVLLQDWLQELAALAQEQTVAVPSLEFKVPSS
ncbi:hypothetical protein Pmani_005958 [Petrolisthes manimaculis]|uniref:FHF complex subunit HOOK-interacting protein C-terminal domain-containing protein n=1 Tax=Petrolisthes manimaculis TaxID=1843537 RepID=A0AAE1ULN9_9EUCA|nr:hypothetical protein Pmani_005958 [Petrolisthes manimaculis]